MVDNKEIKLKKIPEGVEPTINLRIITTFIFLISSSFLFFWDKVNVSVAVPLILIFWILEQFLAFLIIKIQKKSSRINSIFLWQFVFDLIVLTIIAHYIGAVEWIGAIFYIFTIIYSVFFVPETWKRIFLILTACFLYSGLVFLEYFEIIPFFEIFSNKGHYDNLSYVFTTALLINSSFILIAVTINIFAGMLRRKIKELDSAKIELNKSKVDLEKKIRLRTKELEELTNNLEIEVQKRTKELQVKIDELERFSKLTIDREIKMIELKKELKRIKK